MAKEYLQQLVKFIDRVRNGRYDNIELECKHFFSGAALYANNRICITLTPVGLGVKLPPRSREQLLANEKAITLKYFSKAPVKKDYVLFPDGLETGHKLIDQYVREGIDYVLSLPDPKSNQVIVAK